MSFHYIDRKEDIKLYSRKEKPPNFKVLITDEDRCVFFYYKSPKFTQSPYLEILQCFNIFLSKEFRN